MKEKKSLESLPIWTSCLLVVAGEADPYKPRNYRCLEKLYARGSSDDKGPTMAPYYDFEKIIKDLGLPVSKRVRFVVSTDEESG